MADISVNSASVWAKAGANNVIFVSNDGVSGVSSPYPYANVENRLFKCDGEYFLSKYVNNSSTKYQGSTPLTSTGTYSLGTLDQIQWLKDNNYINPDTYFNSAWSSYYKYWSAEIVSAVSDSSNSPTYGLFYVDTYNPHYSDTFRSCSDLVVLNVYSSYANDVRFIPKYSMSVADSGSDSNNYNDLISAILMIPATIICLACMSVIYKMFMSRKLRGE